MTVATGFRPWTGLALAAAAAAACAGLSACAAQPASSPKLDATLAAIAREASAGPGAQPAPARHEAVRPEQLVATILRFEGSLDAVRAQGAVVRSVIGNIATVDIPAGKLAAVAALPGVVSIEVARAQPLRPETRP